MVIPHRLEFPGRSRQRDHHTRAHRQPQPRRRAARIVEHGRPCGHHRLPTIDRRHLHVATGKSPRDGLDHGRVFGAGHTRDGHHCLTRQVVIGGPEPAGRDHDVGAADGQSQRGLERLGTITNDTFGDHLDAKVVETTGQEERVGIHPERRQQFGADREDFSCQRNVQRPGHHHRIPVTTTQPYTPAIKSSAMMPTPPGRSSSWRAGHGLMMSKIRKTKNPMIAP